MFALHLFVYICLFLYLLFAYILHLYHLCIHLPVYLFHFQANMSPDMSEVETLIRMKNEHLIYSTISTIGCLHGSGNKHG